MMELLHLSFCQSVNEHCLGAASDSKRQFEQGPIFTPLNQAKSQKRGFTLIELLVVIAIIAILAAILFPVFAKAREKARQTTCLSNEKQLGLAILQYQQDYDEKFPCGASTGDNGVGWAGQVYSYAKSTGVYKCPDDSTSNDPFNGVPISYAFNENMAGGGATGTLASLGAPASTVLLCEVQSVTSTITAPDNAENATGGAGYRSPAADGLDTNVSTTAPSDLINAKGGTYQYQGTKYASGVLGGLTPTSLANHYTGQTGIHSDGANFLLGDGHAKWLRGPAVSPGHTGTAGQYQNQTAGQAAATDKLYLDNGTTAAAATFSPI